MPKQDDAIMIIDSDEEEEEPEMGPEVPVAEFEEEADEIDPARPYEDILRYIDIHSGIKVLGLAVPPHAPGDVASPLEVSPPILMERIVFAAIYADTSVHLFSLPLTPPHPTVDQSQWGLQSFTISEGSVQTIPAGISITFTARKSQEDTRDKPPVKRAENAWDVLAAVHSSDATGVLSIYRIQIIQTAGKSHQIFSFPSGPVLPIQRHYFRIPARTVSFNPAPFPAEQHSHLLVAFEDGSIKLYSCLPDSQKQGLNESSENEGRWLLTLYSQLIKGPSGTMKRKEVVDAKWVLEGKAVMALLSDGTWGIWDIHGAGPSHKSSNLFAPQDSSDQTELYLSSFSLSGRIVGPAPTTKSLLAPAPAADHRQKFVPVTPGTRRIREDMLFRGRQIAPVAQSSIRGAISVTTMHRSVTGLSDESIVIWHGGQNMLIPSLLSFWRFNAKGNFDPSNRNKPQPISGINLLGQLQTGVSQLRSPSSHNKLGGEDSIKHDILIAAEHQLILLAPALDAVVAENSRQPTAVAAYEATDSDQELLNRGELDIGGMSRVLAGMAGGLSPESPSRQGWRRGLPIS